MSLQRSREEHAVFFFSDRKLVRQLLWLEFEAVLDGFVPLVEQANQTVHAVYLKIVPGLAVKSAVFFLIDFDHRGFADKRWNIPLDQISQNAADGPDLGAGAIKLACRSQCSISWLQDQLWDPDMQSEDGHFAIIRKAVADNRLNLMLVDAGTSPGGHFNRTLYETTDSGTHNRKEQELSEQRLKLATLQERQRQELENQKLEHQQSAEAQQQVLEDERQKNERLHAKIADLEKIISGQRQKVHGLRDYFEHKFDRMKSVDKAAIETLTRQHEVEKEEAIREAVASFREQLQIRDIEMMYRDTQISGLQEEIERQQREKQELLENSGNKLLGRLHASGISFVTFQPGAGQITVPLDDIAAFMEDKTSYVAAKCGVSRAQYKDWLSHYKHPVCSGVLSNGQVCGQGLKRIAHPAEFANGKSDRCAKHQQSSETLSASVSP